MHGKRYVDMSAEEKREYQREWRKKYAAQRKKYRATLVFVKGKHTIPLSKQKRMRGKCEQLLKERLPYPKIPPQLFVARWRRRHPNEVAAHRAVFVAKRNGTLKQLPCVVCGSERSEAHHEDYSKPLDVVWLCKPHHAIADVERRKRLKLDV